MNPEHYHGASPEGLPILACLGIVEGLDRDLRHCAEQHYQWLLRDAYLFSACKYLWRLGRKGDRDQDAEKALDYLQWWMDWHNDTTLYPVPYTAVWAARDALKALT